MKSFIILISILVFLPFLYAQVLMAKTAVSTITSPIAVIYKDRRLKVPMGYMRKGKKVKVNIENIKTRKVLPISVEGKIGHIKASDLGELENYETYGSKILKHDIDRSLMNDRDRQSVNNSAYIILSTGQSGADWEDLTKFMGDKNVGHTNSFELKLIHHPKDNSFFIGVGLKYIKIDQRSVKLVTTLGNVTTYYQFLRRDNLSLQGKASVLFSGDVQVDSAFSKEPSRGIALGFNAGIFARFFPDSKYGTLLGIFTEKIKFSELESVQNKNGKLYPLKEISGSSLYAGVTYHF